MEQVTILIRHFTEEGPSYEFSPSLAKQLQLLQQLVAARFLDDCDAADAKAWINQFFPTCFECCGTALHLLKDPTEDAIAGLIRMADMCLLVLRAGFDYFETRRDDIATLMEILAPIGVEALIQLANPSIHSSRDASECGVRALQTCLSLLIKLGPELKKNRSCQAVQVVRTLLDIVQHSFQVGTDDIFVAIAQFLETALFDMQVSANDKEAVSDTLIEIFKKLLIPYTASESKMSPLLSTTFDAMLLFLTYSNVASILRPSLMILVQTGDVKLLHTRHAIMSQTYPYHTRDACIDQRIGRFSGSDAKLEVNPETVASSVNPGDTRSHGGLENGTHERDTTGVTFSMVRSLHDATERKTDVPQWFCDDGSDDDNTEIDISGIPQWFDDDEEDGGDNDVRSWR